MSDQHIYILLYKPFDYLSQFTPESPDDKCLADIPGIPPKVYPVGRLDKDSEGLILLTNDSNHKTQIQSPKAKQYKTYILAVEGEPNMEAIQQLESGITIRVNKKDHKCAPAKIKLLNTVPDIVHYPGKPIRYRKSIPVSYMEVSISEGKNRQVRRMLAKVGHPVLRLIRTKIGNYTIDQLQPGEWCYVNKSI